MTNLEILQTAKNSIQLQSSEIQNLSNLIEDAFAAIIQTIHTSKGRLVISGIGKSGIIAQKIVATLNSTGTPSLYMHAADAIHGDLGMLLPDDVMMIISKSGESEEIKVLTRLVKKFGNTLIGMCGNENSFLAKECTYFLNTTVSKEACPNNLAPTTSTTAQMVMGDALAICLLEMKGFTAQDFAKFHPGGALGKQLYLQVGDISKQNAAPKVALDAHIKEVIVTISTNRLGATAVLQNDNLKGIITDGDIRRMLEKENDWHTFNAVDIMNSNPKSIQATDLAVNALEQMRKYNILQLVVMDNEKYIGFVHLHDLLREGLV
ncbi:MAG: KpsF/GutQ family sugar-phosphate isomerase [Chitinophagaceae bacterium]|nr:KpsF/GutQ family sugar-phosphate isomerase [Chitinophagaceae bacterium]